MSKDDLIYEYDHDDVDEVIDEAPGSNSFLALRKVRWNSDNEFKLDLRKYFVKADGTEVAGKGISFMTPKGPTTLINKLLENGYGEASSITQTLLEKDRDGVIKGISQYMMSTEMLDQVTADLNKEFYKPEAESAKHMLDKLLV